MYNFLVNLMLMLLVLIYIGLYLAQIRLYSLYQLYYYIVNQVLSEKNEVMMPYNQSLLLWIRTGMLVITDIFRVSLSAPLYYSLQNPLSCAKFLKLLNHKPMDVSYIDIITFLVLTILTHSRLFVNPVLTKIV